MKMRKRHRVERGHGVERRYGIERRCGMEWKGEEKTDKVRTDRRDQDKGKHISPFQDKESPLNRVSQFEIDPSLKSIWSEKTCHKV